MHKAYIAGALNSNAVGYIKNLHRMIIHSEKIRRLGVAVFVPGIDCLVGITTGDLEYNDYFDNSQPWLDSADFLYVAPEWEKSTGTHREILRATGNGTPIFFEEQYLNNTIQQFIKPHIICLIGESGSGKSVLASLLQLKGYSLIESYTTRPPRHEGETGHAFVTNQQFDEFNKNEMIAFTKFGEHKYCCLKQDVKHKNTYVIDDAGYQYLKKHFSNIYNIFAVRIHTDIKQRAQFANHERIERDKKMFFLADKEYDSILLQNYEPAELHNTINCIISKSITKFSKHGVII